MPKTSHFFLLCSVLAVPGAAPALASSPVTFVSGKGADGGNCADPAKPCRSFQSAHDQTSAGGEIKALDPAPYGGVIITKSISITGVEGASINRPSGDHITINAGVNDVVNLSHLILDGGKTALHGIQLNSGGSLTVTHCTVRNFTRDGILLQPAGATKFLIADVTVSDNGRSGVNAQGTGSAQGTLDHVSANNNNSDGITVFSPATVLAVDSTAANNTRSGFHVNNSGVVLRLAHSAATGNGRGVTLAGGGTAESAGDNFIAGNSSRDVDGTLTPAPLRLNPPPVLSHRLAGSLSC